MSKNTVTLYKVTCTKGYQMSEQGENFSLSPWSNNTSYYEGYDDGGKEYILPEGYEVDEGNDEQLHIYDSNGSYCVLSKKFNSPCILSNNGEEIMLKQA